MAQTNFSAFAHRSGNKKCHICLFHNGLLLTPSQRSKVIYLDSFALSNNWIGNSDKINVCNRGARVLYKNTVWCNCWLNHPFTFGSMCCHSHLPLQKTTNRLTRHNTTFPSILFYVHFEIKTKSAPFQWKLCVMGTTLF